MHALIAVGTSIIVGLVTIRPGDYRYWRYWASPTFSLASAGLILSYGVAGLAGFAVLHAVEPNGASAGAAAVEGFAGHAVFRARIDFGGIGDEPVGESLLGLVRGWLLDWLSGDTRTAIRSRLAKLDDDDLVELAFDILAPRCSEWVAVLARHAHWSRRPVCRESFAASADGRPASRSG
jgi:hypothetical protein